MWSSCSSSSSSHSLEGNEVSMTDHPILLFDGVCNLCTGAVQFIIRRDPNAIIRFASLQSEIGQSLLATYGLKPNLTSIVFIENSNAYTYSDAGLRISRYLTGAWRFAAWLRIIPRPIRDIVYRFIAANRYRWFGRRSSCMLPTEDIKSRFLD